MNLYTNDATFSYKGKEPAYGTNRPLRATKFSRPKEICQLLADVIYQNAVGISVGGAGVPIKEKIIAMLAVVSCTDTDDIVLLPFREKKYIDLFMDNEEEKAHKAFEKGSFTFQTTRLKFQPFKTNIHSTKRPLRQRVILALEGVPPESWNSEAITELLDNSCMVEEIYGQHHIQDLTASRLAAWTTDIDLIPKIIEWNIETRGPMDPSEVDWNRDAAGSTILVHIEKLFDYFDEDSGSDTDGETLRHYEESRPRKPVIKHFQ